ARSPPSPAPGWWWTCPPWRRIWSATAPPRWRSRNGGWPPPAARARGPRRARGRSALGRPTAGAAGHGHGGRAAGDLRFLGLDHGRCPAAAGRERHAGRARRRSAVRGHAVVRREAAVLRPRGRARPAPGHRGRPVAGARGHPQPHRATAGPAADHAVRPGAGDPARGRGGRRPRPDCRARALPAPRPGRRAPGRGGGVSPRRYRPRGLYLGLALLTFCAVFAAIAGARETLASRTQAVRQTVAATLPPTRTVTVSAAWSDVQGALSNDSNADALTPVIPPATINAVGDPLHADFSRARV